MALGQVADFSNGFDPAQWPPIWEDFFCDWRKLVLDKIEPPSWVISDMVLTAGFQGVLFPSAANAGGTNLFVYTAQLTTADTLAVNNPHGDLPKGPGFLAGQSRRSPPLPVRPAQLALIACAAESGSIESAASSLLCDDAC